MDLKRVKQQLAYVRGLAEDLDTQIKLLQDFIDELTPNAIEQADEAVQRYGDNPVSEYSTSDEWAGDSWPCGCGTNNEGWRQECYHCEKPRLVHYGE